MALPRTEDIYLPFLQVLREHGQLALREVRDELAAQLHLSEEELNEPTLAGKGLRFPTHVGWASTDLFKAGLVYRPQYGRYALTEEGERLLDSSIDRVDINTLLRYESFVEWRHTLTGKDVAPADPAEAASDSDRLFADDTPEDVLMKAYRAMWQRTISDLQDTLLEVHWKRFERIVIDLLQALGYGGGVVGRGFAFQTTKDGGIDGVINEDALGLSKIYVQAKRWAPTNMVGRPLLQQFVGSLVDKGAAKGVFITTSRYTTEATAYYEKVKDKHQLVLIDGAELLEHMWTTQIGLVESRRLVLFELDRNYFDEDT